MYPRVGRDGEEGDKSEKGNAEMKVDGEMSHEEQQDLSFEDLWCDPK